MIRPEKQEDLPLWNESRGGRPPFHLAANVPAILPRQTDVFLDIKGKMYYC